MSLTDLILSQPFLTQYTTSNSANNSSYDLNKCDASKPYKNETECIKTNLASVDVRMQVYILAVCNIPVRRTMSTT